MRSLVLLIVASWLPVELLKGNRFRQSERLSVVFLSHFRLQQDYFLSSSSACDYCQLKKAVMRFDWRSNEALFDLSEKKRRQIILYVIYFN